MVTSTLIQTTPEQLTVLIVSELDKKLNELKTQFQPKEPTELLTRSEVRNLLKVNMSTLHLWTKKGKLKSYGIGNRVYYKRHEIENTLIQLNK